MRQTGSHVADLREEIGLKLPIHKDERKKSLTREIRSAFWCRISDSPPIHPSSSKSQDSPPLDSQHSCEQMAESQEESTTFSLRTALVNRRHSADGTLSSGSGPILGRGYAEPNRFHPYRRQFSEGVVIAASPLQQCSPTFSCVQEVCSPDSCSCSSCSDAPASCDYYNGNFQVSRLMNSYSEEPAAPGEPSCFLSDSYAPSGPIQQGSSRLYPTDDQASGSKYSLSTQSHQENTTHSFFPKPIYSYSILIFMALKNSKTGSLPVSEIYSFMTEHFPYFKTAPDGWKNSVRHNLSLNKCFVKVENKNGNSSRKGCLWALNPAKVEKMQDEMHKWRRKDPLTIRRSMARPECLDRLLGERAEKLRSLSAYTNPAVPSKVASIYSSTSLPRSSAQIPPSCPSLRPPPYGHVQPKQPCYLPPAATHPSNSFALYSPCGQPAAAVSLNSPMAGKMPPVYHTSLQAEYGVGPRSMQDFQLEGDATYDIDTLNPSLTDLQLQGNLWEELREDSVVSDPHVTTTTMTPSTALHDHHLHPRCLPPPASRRKADYEDETEDTEQMLDQHGCLNGLHPVVYSGVESLTGYPTSCTTSISLI